MPEFDEFQLERSTAPLPPPSQPKWVLVVVGVVLLLAVFAIAYYYRRADRKVGHPDRVDVKQQVAAAAPSSQFTDVPPLEQSDLLVRELVRALSSHPVIASWLTTDQLIRNYTVSVLNVAEGDTPARHLRIIAPAGTFQVRRERGVIYIDERTYARFDEHAAAVAALDPKGAAQLYRRLKPRIDEAYRELAGPNADFDRTLRRAIVNLLETPIVEGPVAVRPSAAGYDYVDPSLQSLSRAQQQLVRMGPQNARRIQQTLRAIALELGIVERSQ